jgi:hypothetical protein
MREMRALVAEAALRRMQGAQPGASPSLDA